MLTLQSPPNFARHYAAASSFASDRITFAGRAGKLTLIANTAEKAIRILVPHVTLSADFAFSLLPAKPGEVFASLSSSPAMLSLNQSGEIAITQAGSRFRMNTLSGDTSLYPGMVMPSTITLAHADFRSGLSRVLNVASTDAADLARSNPDGSSGSVFFDWDHAALTFATFDRSRLAAQTVPAVCQDESRENYGNIVPSRFLSLVSTLVNAAKEAVHVGFSPKAVRVRCGPYVAVSALATGRFTPWRKLIVTPERTVSLAASSLLTAVEQAATLCSGDSRAITLTLGGGRIALKGHASELGSSEVAIPCPEAIEPYAITFTAPSLINGLRPIADSPITLRLSNNSLSEIRSDQYIYRLCCLITD